MVARPVKEKPRTMLSADQANRRYFHESYRTGEHGWAASDPSRYTVRFLERLNRIVPGGKVLDIGCGEGRHSFAAATLGFRVIAMDYEPLALDRASRFAKVKGINGVTFVEADLFRMPFIESCFDVVLDCGCLHHQRKSDWRVYKAGVLRTLKPQGYFVLSVFSPEFRFFVGSRRSWHIAYGAYRRCFTPDQILDLFGRHFDVIEMVEQPGDHDGFWHVLMNRRAQPPVLG